MSGVRELLKHLKWVGENMLGGKEVRKKKMKGKKNKIEMEKQNSH